MTTSVPPTKAPAPWVGSQRQADTKALEMGFASMGITPTVKLDEVRVPNLSVSSVSTGDGSVGSGSSSLKFQPPGTPPSYSRNVVGVVSSASASSVLDGEASKSNPGTCVISKRVESGASFPSPIGKSTSFAPPGISGSPQEALNSGNNPQFSRATGLRDSLPLLVDKGVERLNGDVRNSIVSEGLGSSGSSNPNLSKSLSSGENDGSLFEGVRLNLSPRSNLPARVPLSHVRNSNGDEPGSPSFIGSKQSKSIGELFRPGSFEDENIGGRPPDNLQPFTRSRAHTSPGPIELSRIGYIGGGANAHLGSNSPSASSFSNAWEGQGNDGDRQLGSTLQFRNFAAGHIPELTTTEGGGISSTGFFGGLRRGTSLNENAFRMQQTPGDLNEPSKGDGNGVGVWPSNPEIGKAGSDNLHYDVPSYGSSNITESPRVVGGNDFSSKVARSASFGYSANEYMNHEPSDQPGAGNNRGSMMSNRREPGSSHPQLQHALSDVGAHSSNTSVSSLGGSGMSFGDSSLSQRRGGGAPMRGRSFTDGNLVDQEFLFESNRGRFPSVSFQGDGGRFGSGNFRSIPAGFESVPRRRTMSAGNDAVTSHYFSQHGGPYQSGQGATDMISSQFRFQSQQQMQLQTNSQGQPNQLTHMPTHPQMQAHSQMHAQGQTQAPVHFQSQTGHNQVLEHRESQFHGSSHQVGHVPPHAFGGVRGSISEYGQREENSQLQQRHHEVMYEGGRQHQMQHRQVYGPDIGENHPMQGRQGRGYPAGRGGLVMSRSVSGPGMIENHRDMLVDTRSGTFFRGVRQQAVMVGSDDGFNGQGNQNSPIPAGVYHHNLQPLQPRDNVSNVPDAMSSDQRFLAGRLSPSRSIPPHLSQIHSVGVSSPTRQDRMMYSHDNLVDVRMHRSFSADMGTKVSSFHKLEHVDDGSMLPPVMPVQHSDICGTIHHSPHINSRSISSMSSSSSSMEQAGMLPQYRGADSSTPCLPVSAGPRLVFNVKFKRTQRSFILGPRAPRDVKVGCYVKVEADRGEDLGIVVSRVPADKFNITTRPSFRLSGSSTDTSSSGAADLKKIIRRATHDEINLLVEKREEEENLLKVCRAKVKQRGLTMNVVDAEYQFDRHKLIFFFEAEGRIDFRELVRDLFSIYKTRIWMQQLDKGGSSSVTGSTGGCSGGEGSLDGQDPMD